MVRGCDADHPPGSQSDINYQHYTYVLACLVGQCVTVRLRNNATFSGLFYSYNINGPSESLDNVLILKYAQQLADGNQLSGPIEDVAIIHNDDIVFISATKCPLTFDELKPRGSTSFKIDSEIRKNMPVVTERELERWEPPSGDGSIPLLEMPLGEDPKASWGVSWNQFEVNARQFKVKSTYQEDFYTTPLDMGSIPQCVKEKADQIAREIESANVHTIDEYHDDEEALFGAIRGTGVYTSNPIQKPLITKNPVQSSINPDSITSKEMFSNITNSSVTCQMIPGTSKAVSSAVPIITTTTNLKPIARPYKDNGPLRFGAYLDKNRHLGRVIDREQEKKNFLKASEAIRNRMMRIDWNSSTTKRTGPSVAVPLSSKKSEKESEKKTEQQEDQRQQARDVTKRSSTRSAGLDTGGTKDVCVECSCEDGSTEKKVCPHTIDGKNVDKNKVAPKFRSFKTNPQYHDQHIENIMSNTILKAMPKDDPATTFLSWNAHVDPSVPRLVSYTNILCPNTNTLPRKSTIPKIQRIYDTPINPGSNSTSADHNFSVMTSRPANRESLDDYEGINETCLESAADCVTQEPTEGLQRAPLQDYTSHTNSTLPRNSPYTTTGSVTQAFAYIPTTQQQASVPVYVQEAYSTAFVTHYNGNYYMMPRNTVMSQNMVGSTFLPEDTQLINPASTYSNASHAGNADAHALNPVEHNSKMMIENNHIASEIHNDEIPEHLRNTRAAQNSLRDPLHFHSQVAAYPQDSSHNVTVPTETSNMSFIPSQNIYNTQTPSPQQTLPSSVHSTTQYTSHMNDSQQYTDVCQQAPTISTPMQWIVTPSTFQTESHDPIQHETTNCHHRPSVPPIPSGDIINQQMQQQQQQPPYHRRQSSTYQTPGTRGQVHVTYSGDNASQHPQYTYSNCLDSCQQSQVQQPRLQSNNAGAASSKSSTSAPVASSIPPAQPRTDSVEPTEQ